MNPLVQPDPGLYVWTITTFLVLMVLLRKFAWRPLLEALEHRQSAIRQSLDDARQARQEMERVQADANRILAEARSKADVILNETRADAARFRDELKDKARGEAAALVKTAERQIQLEKARAVQEIRQEAIGLSVDIAAKLLQRHVSASDNERLIDDTLREMQSRPTN